MCMTAYDKIYFRNVCCHVPCTLIRRIIVSKMRQGDDKINIFLLKNLNHLFCSCDLIFNYKILYCIKYHLQSR